ncbi:MAG: hypothetical protein PXX73_10310 [Sideroxydans sp.]|nr:hypothetical protein [Sideroxydans sp.]
MAATPVAIKWDAMVAANLHRKIAAKVRAFFYPLQKIICTHTTF